MDLFYLVKIGKKNEMHSVDASVFIERIRKMRALNHERSTTGKERDFMGTPPIKRKRIFFRNID